MRLPLVSRAAHEEIVAQRDYFRARVEALTADLLTMRRDGFSVAKPAVVHEPPDEEAQGLKLAERELIQRRDDAVFVQRAAERITRDHPGVSPAQARAEAIRLRKAVTDEDPPV